MIMAARPTRDAVGTLRLCVLFGVMATACAFAPSPVPHGVAKTLGGRIPRLQLAEPMLRQSTKFAQRRHRAGAAIGAGVRMELASRPEAGSAAGLDFQALQQLSNRIEAMRAQQVNFIKGFYNSNLGFVHGLPRHY